VRAKWRLKCHWTRRTASDKPLKLLRLVEAAIGFEPMHGGFADLSLNHLGTPPRLCVTSDRTQSSITR
jgi:hypothetical protein